MLVAPGLICHPTEPDPPPLVPGRPDRTWMDETSDRFAYRCIPLSIANASGWEILSPCSFRAEWNGGPLKEDIIFSLIGGQADFTRRVASHFGSGILTFHTGYLFRTPPGWGLWCRGAPNTVKHGITALDGLVETDWLPMPFTMNWRFTAPGAVDFEKGEPFCFITLAPHAQMDEIEPVVRSLDADPALKSAYEAWTASRADFNSRLAALEPAAVAEGWQRLYVRGETLTGEASGHHLSRRKLKKPRREAET
ncbi:DUF6065 family protein [Methylocapsa palsarum]|uniref:Uncharacterized protein n=1 Tax=Methylocapsa palsarum TaxID=1612308 RepID=A0A1I4A2J2_9HYPH|nr:DUF6065 family protein [Methylocapsa palsarum]SFK50086.1 hypothetical protein SAMN05444581_10924 [Methylocapsa palsarum]